jgi:hypothetical protein
MLGYEKELNNIFIPVQMDEHKQEELGIKIILFAENEYN